MKKNVEPGTISLENCKFENVQINLSEHRWISVDKALPEMEQDVIVRFLQHYEYFPNVAPDVGVCVRWRTADDSVLRDDHQFLITKGMEITHWMTIPEINE